MRISILSDIHSNYEALVKALSLADQLRTDEIYCLGDIVGYGGSPNECVHLIQKRASKCVIGNHDLAAVDTSHARCFTKHGTVAAEWTHKILTKENLDYLSSLPYTSELELLTLVHANPAKPQDWGYISSLEDALPQFAHFKTPLCFIGHSHIPFVCGEDLKTLYFKKDLRFIINVGSVGQPRDGNPQLSFGILDTETRTYENIRSDYDVASAAQTIIDHGLPRFLADRLFLGV
ncbi:MAG: metallophosphoesterase family protein [Ignavibacteriae bacterium]|nr:metallophosphoesterase family protein [Ignavibacteriota bacterium]